MPTISYKDLVTKLRREIWPEGEAPNLVSPHNSMFLAAFVDLQNSVPELQRNNITIHPFCSTYVDCAKTVIPAPVGEIQFVYTVANDKWCDPVFYDWRKKVEIDAWIHNDVEPFFVDSDSTIVFQQGMKLANRQSDSKWGRARIGSFALHHKKIWLAPWIQSNEVVVVEWDGVKRTFADTDVLDQDWWDIEAEAIIQAFVRWRHEVAYGREQTEKMAHYQDHHQLRAMFIVTCADKTRMRNVSVPTRRLPIKAELDNDQLILPVVNASVTLWQTADTGNTADTQEVADLIAAGSPAMILHAGDISYNDTAYATVVDDYFDKTIFFSAPGNHDWDFGNLVPYLVFFSDYPNNQRYYDKVIGSLHIFFMDWDAREEDGIAVNSAQWEWLNAKARLSPAKWKMVVGHLPPFSSGPHGSTAAVQYDFSDMGIDIVVSGHDHDYEHLLIDDVHYLVDGLGGKEKYNFGAPVSGSVTRYNSKFGAVKFSVSCTTLAWDFITVDGDVIDTVELTK